MLRTILIAVAIVPLSCPVRGEVVEYEFAGRVIETDPVLGLHPPLGSAVNGHFSYDTSLPPQPEPPDGGWFSIPAPHKVVVNLDGHTIESGSMTINIRKTVGFFRVFAGDVAIDGVNIPDGVIGISLQGTPGITNPILSDFQLPSELVLSRFDFTRYGELFQGGPVGPNIAFGIDSLTRIPSPSAGVLAIVGFLIVLLYWTRRRVVERC